MPRAEVSAVSLYPLPLTEPFVGIDPSVFEQLCALFVIVLVSPRFERSLEHLRKVTGQIGASRSYIVRAFFQCLVLIRLMLGDDP